MILLKTMISGGSPKKMPNESPIKKIFLTILTLVLILLMNHLPVIADEVVIKSDDQMAFALQYMEKQEYSRAIGEFERFVYFFPDNKRVPEALYLIAICQIRGKHYEKARSTLTEVIGRDFAGPFKEKAIYMIGESYYLQGLTRKAEDYFVQFVDHYPQSELQDEAMYRLGRIRLKDGRWQEASETFGEIKPDSSLYPHSLDLSQRALEGNDLPYKDPKLAGILAGIIPGAGHVYSNRPRDGLIAFLLNGIFIYAAVESFDQDLDAVGGIAALLEAGWYSGNIYSAVNSVHKYNRKKRDEFIRTMPDAIDQDRFTGKGNIPAISFKIDF